MDSQRDSTAAMPLASPAGAAGHREFELLIANREKVLPWIKEYSPIELVSAGRPADLPRYPNQKTPPEVGQKEPDPTHSAMYGVGLAEVLDDAGVEVVLAYPGREDTKYGSLTKFLIAKLAKRTNATSVSSYLQFKLGRAQTQCGGKWIGSPVAPPHLLVRGISSRRDVSNCVGECTDSKQGRRGRKRPQHKDGQQNWVIVCHS